MRCTGAGGWIHSLSRTVAHSARVPPIPRLARACGPLSVCRMNTLRLPAKIGAVALGLVVAFAVAWIAVEVRQRTTQGPDAQASAGMYAFGDLLLGVAVFGVIALLPLALGLYWLRPVARFWSALVGGALLFAMTGILALAAGLIAGGSTSSWLLLAHVRFGLMPLSALALLACALFAPQPRQRWLLLVSAMSDGIIFVGVVLVKFVLPHFTGNG